MDWVTDDTKKIIVNFIRNNSVMARCENRLTFKRPTMNTVRGKTA